MARSGLQNSSLRFLINFTLTTVTFSANWVRFFRRHCNIFADWSLSRWALALPCRRHLMQDEDAQGGRPNAMRRHVPRTASDSPPSCWRRRPPPAAHVGTRCQSNKVATANRWLLFGSMTPAAGKARGAAFVFAVTHAGPAGIFSVSFGSGGPTPPSCSERSQFGAAPFRLDTA